MYRRQIDETNANADLLSVIIPTVTSLQAAIRKYEEQGGTASVFVNDDGMQTVSADLAE
jgi:hypothetical protein